MMAHVPLVATLSGYNLTQSKLTTRASKNAIFGLNSLPTFWTPENAVYCLWALDFGPNSGGPKNGQGKLADLDALTHHPPFSTSAVMSGLAFSMRHIELKFKSRQDAGKCRK